MADPIRSFRHFRDVPETLWRWRNFSPAEIACRGTGQLKLHPAALDTLQALRDRPRSQQAFGARPQEMLTPTTADLPNGLPVTQ